MDFKLWVSIISTLVVGLIWAIRLEGRVNGHDTLFAERVKQEQDRQKLDDERHADNRRRLERIESKLDRLRTSPPTPGNASIFNGD